MRYLQRAWTFMYERQWAAAMGLVSGGVIIANETLDVVSTQVETSGPDFNWYILLAIAQALATRWNVWSARSVAQVATGGGDIAVGD
jgi:hypothetical protein